MFSNPSHIWVMQLTSPVWGAGLTANKVIEFIGVEGCINDHGQVYNYYNKKNTNPTWTIHLSFYIIYSRINIIISNSKLYIFFILYRLPSIFKLQRLVFWFLNLLRFSLSVFAFVIFLISLIILLLYNLLSYSLFRLIFCCCLHLQAFLAKMNLHWGKWFSSCWWGTW